MKNWQAMDEAALDDAYDNRSYIPGAEQFPPRWQAAAAAFRGRGRAECDLPYGDGPREAFDLFHPAGTPDGLTVFIHGGYWRAFAKDDWSHFAEGALSAGQAVAMVGYPLAPSVRISRITKLVAKGIAAAAARVAGPIRLTGHSAGGHLAARMLMPDVALPCLDRVVTCVPISPVSDLRPLVPQTGNADWRLDEAEAEAESPALGQPAAHVRTTVHVGADERPSFLWQAAALAEAWQVSIVQAPGVHHFDVIDALRDPSSSLMRDILA